MGVNPTRLTRRERRSKYTTTAPKPRNRRRRVLIAVGALAALLVIGFGVRVLGVLNSVSRGGPGAFLGILTDQSALADQLSAGQRVNILLLGYGGPNHDGPYLTDSIMVVSLNPRTHQAAQISIPRDTEVRISAFADGESVLEKINTAFAIGMQPESWGKLKPEYTTTDPDKRDAALKLAEDVVTQLTGVHIDYGVAVDFAGFQKAVDDIGGVDVNVENTFTADFPVGETNAWETIHFDAGPQHMNGTRALDYVRARYVGCSETGLYRSSGGTRLCKDWPITQNDVTEASDFARARRQQLFMQAFRQASSRPGFDVLSHVNDLASVLSDDVRTTMDVASLRSLWDKRSLFEDKSLVHVSLNNQNLLYDCTCDYNGYTLHMYDDGTTLHRFLDNLFQPRAVAEDQVVQVVNGGNSGDVALGSIWTDLLRQVGFRTQDPANATHGHPTSEVHDYSGGKAANTVEFLSSYFGASVVTETVKPAGSADVVLVLGQDFAAQFSPPAASNGYYTPSAPQPSPKPTPQRAPSPTPAPTPVPSPTPTVPRPTASPVCVPPLCSTPSPAPSPRPSPSP
ncbi:MAG: LCP family protein [Candidatus Dormibacteria bacterium]